MKKYIILTLFAVSALILSMQRQPEPVALASREYRWLEDDEKPADQVETYKGYYYWSNYRRECYEDETKKVRPEVRSEYECDTLQPEPSVGQILFSWFFCLLPCLCCFCCVLYFSYRSGSGCFQPRNEAERERAREFRS
jgi:hypothetical protein